MTTIFSKADIEAAAKAMKEVLRVAWDGKPLLGNDRSGDWYADGGSINLADLFQAALTAAEASMKARGAMTQGHAEQLSRDGSAQTILGDAAFWNGTFDFAIIRLQEE